MVSSERCLPMQKWIKMLSKAPRMNFHVTTLRDVSETCFKSVQDVSKHLDIVHLEIILEYFLAILNDFGQFLSYFGTFTHLSIFLENFISRKLFSNGIRKPKSPFGDKNAIIEKHACNYWSDL